MGSWLGRSVLALPAALGAVAAGVLVIGISGRAGPGFVVMGVVGLASLLRISRTGVMVDPEASEVQLTTFWRTHHIDTAQLAFVDTERPAEGPPSLRFVTTDGREVRSTALLGSSDAQIGRFLGLLSSARHEGGFEVHLDASSFRPTAAA